MNQTIDYYNRNADIYFESTVGADFTDAHERFCAYLPKGARIIDIGCGSGRDVWAFLEGGYLAMGLDAVSGVSLSRVGGETSTSGVGV